MVLLKVGGFFTLVVILFPFLCPVKGACLGKRQGGKGRVLIPWSGFEPEMVISNPFVQPLRLLPIRGVSSPPLPS